MMEGAFYQPKKTSPTALAIVVLMHGAGLTALALAKGEILRPPPEPPLVVDTIREKQPPPETPKPPPDPAVARTVETFIDRPKPPEPLPFQGPEVAAGPVAPPPMPFPAGPPVVGPAEPPAPPPKPKTIQSARAKANLASYVSDEDYPSNAARNEEQGTTRFRLAVGPDGKVKDCTVTSSSGSSSLDSTTCRLMRQRARFTPARDSDGNPTSDSVASSIRWVLPE